MVKTIKLTIPEIFSFSQTISFLDRGFDESLYNLTKDTISRLLQLSDGIALIVISSIKNYLQIEIQKENISSENILEVKNYVIEWFDLERDIRPFYNLLAKDDKVSHFTSVYYETRLIGIPDLFEAICWAIIGQQINLTFAYKVKRKLVEKYGQKQVIRNTPFYIFPTPEIIFNIERSSLVEMQFSRQKIDYLKNISEAFFTNKINKKILLKCNNKQEQIELLTSIKGIGIWTANYVLMKSIRNMSCITYGDSGLNSALHTIYKSNKKPNKSEVNLIFKNFKNLESYFNFYLWKSIQ